MVFSFFGDPFAIFIDKVNDELCAFAVFLTGIAIHPFAIQRMFQRTGNGLMIFPDHLITPCAGKHCHENFQHTALMGFIQHIGSIGLVRQGSFCVCNFFLCDAQSCHVCLMYLHFPIQRIMHHAGEQSLQFFLLCFHDTKGKHLGILQQIAVILNHIEPESVHTEGAFPQFLYKRLGQITVPDRFCRFIQSVCQCHNIILSS